MPRTAIAEAESLRREGLAAARRRLFAEAARAFAAWSDLAPDEPEAWLSSARVHLLAGNLNDARSVSERALALDSNRLDVHLFRARLGSLTNDDPMRIGSLKNLLRLRPGGVASRVALARLLLRRTNYMGATIAVNEALALAPDDPNALLIAARCRLGKGRLEEAAALLARLDAEGHAVDVAELRQAREELAERRRKRGLTETEGVMGSAAGENAFVEPQEQGVPAARGGRVRPQDVPANVERPGSQPLVDVPDAAERERIGAAALKDLPLRRTRLSLLDHILIIWSLILRDIALHHRNVATAAVAGLMRPAIVVFAHYWLFYLLRKPMPANIPLAVYVLAGFSTWFVFSGAWSGAELGGKWAGGATSFPGVTDFHMRVAKATWQFALNLTFCLVALVPMRLIGWNVSLPDVPQTFLVLIIAAIMGFGLGLVLERLASVLGLFKTVGKLLTWALFVTSGLYFSIGTTPPILAYWFLYNPLLHLVETERNAFDPGYVVLLVNLQYPAIVSGTLLLFGLLLYRRLPCKTPD